MAFVSEMSHLEGEYPEAFKYLKSGGFSVTQGRAIPWEKFLSSGLRRNCK